MIVGSFPNSRPRRNRQNEWSRDLVRENSLTVKDLIWPLFVQEGDNISKDIKSMPNVKRWTIDLIVEQAAKAHDLGIPAIAIFPQTPEELKSDEGYEGVNPENLV